MFLEVACKSSCKTRRFAAGTDSGFALSLINRKLDFGVPLALHIEAVKEGEEPVSFGPNSILVDYGDGWKLQTVMDEGLEKSKRKHIILEQFPMGMKFLEVVCKSSGKTRRFADGTEAGFSLSLINQKLDFGVPLALHIEAVKEGEEPISFGPNSILVDYGNGWKLQTVVDESVISLEKRKRILLTPERVPTGLFLEVVCKSSGKTRLFAAGTETGFALSLINRKLDFGVPLALHIEAVKEGEEPVSFGPNSILVDYGDGWKLQTVMDEGLEKRNIIHPTPEQFPTGMVSLAETLNSSVVLNDRIANRSLVDASSPHNTRVPEFTPQTLNQTDTQQPRLMISQGPGQMHVFPLPNSPFHVPVQNHVQYQDYGGLIELEVNQSRAVDDPDSVPMTKSSISEEATQNILNQVENLAKNDIFMRFIEKDPEGFVLISVLASLKKIKALISSPSQLATVLRTSSKFIVSEDGKKVRLQHSLTESDMEELQSHIVAENLPEDHSHQNLTKVFSAVGSFKTIHTCQPQTSSGEASAASRVTKMDNMLFSNKSKYAQAGGRKAGHESEVNHEDDEITISEQRNEKQLEDTCQASDEPSQEHTGEEHVNVKEVGSRRGRGRGWGKGRGRGQYNQYSQVQVGTPNNMIQQELLIAATKQPPGPLMPDGTRGFTMGRAKPVL